MRTVIFRSIAPYLTALMLLYSIFVLLRGHNEPGGGFIGGLIAASALAVYGLAAGVSPVRRAIHYHPMALAGFGLLLGAIAGLFAAFAGVPYMTGLWYVPVVLGVEIKLSTTLIFDIGVYLVVVGSITSIALALEERDRG